MHTYGISPVKAPSVNWEPRRFIFGHENQLGANWLLKWPVSLSEEIDITFIGPNIDF
jgi:hypothetical protein